MKDRDGSLDLFRVSETATAGTLITAGTAGSVANLNPNIVQLSFQQSKLLSDAYQVHML